MLKQIFHVLFNIKWLKLNHTHNIVPIMISKSVLVAKAILTSILMSLIVEHAYGVWLLS